MTEDNYKRLRLEIENSQEIEDMSTPINEVLPQIAKVLQNLRHAHQELSNIETNPKGMAKHNWVDLHTAVCEAQLDIIKARHLLDGAVLRLVRGRASDIDDLLRKKKLLKRLNKKQGGAH